MMQFVQLSEKTKEVCRKHYGSYKKCGCGSCPLVRICHRGPTGSGFNLESHNRHIRQLNDAAEQV